MGLVTSLFARKVVEEAEGPADKDALLATLGLERGGPVDPAHMIEDSAYYDFLERVAAVDTDPTTIPLRAAHFRGNVAGRSRAVVPAWLEPPSTTPAFP